MTHFDLIAHKLPVLLDQCLSSMFIEKHYCIFTVLSSHFFTKDFSILTASILFFPKHFSTSRNQICGQE